MNPTMNKDNSSLKPMSLQQLRCNAETCDELKQGPFANDFRWAAGAIERLQRERNSAWELWRVRVPTHRCRICSALWISYPDSWSLWSQSCGKCCDNAAMGDQIEPLNVSDMLRADNAQLQYALEQSESKLSARETSGYAPCPECRMAEGHVVGCSALNGEADPRSKSLGFPPCLTPPKGWICTREPCHEGPCAAHPVGGEIAAEQIERLKSCLKASNQADVMTPSSPLTDETFATWKPNGSKDWWSPTWTRRTAVSYGDKVETFVPLTLLTEALGLLRRARYFTPESYPPALTHEINNFLGTFGIEPAGYSPRTSKNDATGDQP